jgi:hypothetical protein
LSDLPSADPVADELNWITDFNDRIRPLREIIGNARPNISQLVNRIIGTRPDQPIGSELIRSWREQIKAQVVTGAGFAYEGYIRLKLASDFAPSSPTCSLAFAAFPRNLNSHA